MCWNFNNYYKIKIWSVSNYWIWTWDRPLLELNNVIIYRHLDCFIKTTSSYLLFYINIVYGKFQNLKTNCQSYDLKYNWLFDSLLPNSFRYYDSKKVEKPKEVEGKGRGGGMKKEYVIFWIWNWNWSTMYLFPPTIMSCERDCVIICELHFEVYGPTT